LSILRFLSNSRIAARRPNCLRGHQFFHRLAATFAPARRASATSAAAAAAPAEAASSEDVTQAPIGPLARKLALRRPKSAWTMLLAVRARADQLARPPQG